MLRQKILLVECDEKIASALKRGFEEDGFEIEVASNSNQGLKLLDCKSFDLIIADINPPVISKHELCRFRRLKNITIPIIILSTFHSLPDNVDDCNVGAENFMTKPFEFKELLSTVRALQTKTEPSDLPHPYLIHFADLTINRDKKEIMRNQKLIRLTSQEFQLLEYLLLNKNRVVSRADIAANIWNTFVEADDGAIDVYINYIREKIDIPLKKSLIHELPGQGYILRDN